MAASSIVIEDYIDWTEAVSRITARKYSVPLDDAISIGYIKLVEAAQRFDMSKYDSKIAKVRTNFQVYARKAIIGGILDWCRTNKFVKRRGYEQGYRATMVYIDAPHNSSFRDGGTPVSLPIEDMNRDEYMDFRYAMKKRLTKREYQVMAAVSVGVMGSEIARALGVSDMRVSQIIAEARAKLERYMNA